MCGKREQPAIPGREKIFVLHFKTLTAAVTAYVLLLLSNYTAWGRRQKASARADGATNLPWNNFFTLKFEEKSVLVTWSNWRHRNVTLPWFLLMHILLLWKNKYFHVTTPFMSQFWHKNTRSQNFWENVFGHVTNFMAPGRSPPMGHYCPYFCILKKSIFLAVRWVNIRPRVNKWAWQTKKNRARIQFSPTGLGPQPWDFQGRRRPYGRS